MGRLDFGRGLMGGGRPVENLQCAIGMLGQSGTTFDPIAAIIIPGAVKGFDFSLMNVAADHPVRTPPVRFANEGLFIIGDERDDIFEAVLHVGGERPFPETQHPTQAIEPPAHPDHQVVAAIADEG